MRRVISALVLMVVTGGGLRAQGPAAAPSLEARLDGVVARAIAEKRIVGAVVVVARDGRVVYRRAAGLADREAGRPMREGAVFRLASMSKPIVAAAALALVDRGKLSLEDPVTKWIPDFRPRLADGREATIRVRHLLTHTAGLTYRFLEEAGGPYHRANVSDGMDQPGLGIEENLRRIASVPLGFQPGAAWGYSLATDVLGEVVARASGEPLPDAVRNLVTGPLGMKDTGFSVADPSRLATPYADGTPEPARMGDLQVVAFGKGDGIRYAPGRVFDPKSYRSGGAGMVGTADDYLTFLEAVRTGGGSILTPTAARSMATNQVGELSVDAAGPGWGFSFAAAVLKDTRVAATPQSSGTFGWGGAYGHSWFVDPARRLSVVALTDTAIEGMAGKFPVQVRDAVYGVGETTKHEERR